MSDNQLTVLDFQATIKGNFICYNNPLNEFNPSELALLNIHRSILFTPTENMPHYHHLQNDNGYVQMRFLDFKEKQEIVFLKEKLHAQLPSNTQKAKKFKI